MEANTQSCIEKMCVVQLLRAGLGHVAPLGSVCCSGSLCITCLNVRQVGGAGMGQPSVPRWSEVWGGGAPS